jgi:processive 1,2-diacylglycerol beta-glucosyltransferase
LRILVNNRNTINGIPNGIIYHRIYKPFQFMPVEYDYFWNHNEIPDKKYDFLVFNRGLGWLNDDEEAWFIQKCKDSGMKIIMDIDDYWNLPEHHTIRWRPDIDYNRWRQNILNNIMRADYIWTSTEFLKDKIREITDVPIAICKNAIDPSEAQWKNRFPKRKKDRVNIGWIGSLTHYKDLDILQRPLKAINKNFKIWMHMAGYVQNDDWSGKVANHNLGIFTDRGRLKNITTWSPVPIFEYGHLYDQLDISLSPVLDNDFNKCKSELKIIEAGIKKIPFIGSDVLTYSRTGANIDLCTTPQDWADAMKDLIGDRDLRIGLGKELHEYVMDNYSFEKSNRERLSIL